MNGSGAAARLRGTEQSQDEVRTPQCLKKITCNYKLSSSMHNIKTTRNQLEYLWDHRWADKERYRRGIKDELDKNQLE